MKIENLYFENVLKNINLEFNSGELIGLIGNSSGGKSVFLKNLAGVLKATSGNIYNDKKISLCFQEGALFDSLTVYENLRFPLDQENLEEEEINSRVLEFLAKVGLSKAINKYPAQLSGGMRKRISIIRAMINHPDILLLDDPTAGLDPIASNVILNFIAESHSKNIITLIVSHDLRRLLPLSQRIIGLFSGEILFDGKVSELKDSDKVVRDFVSCRFDLNE